MFPITPQYFIDKSSFGDSATNYILPIQTPTSKSKITNKGKIIVTSIIEKDCESKEISIAEILDENQKKIPEEIQVYSRDNRLTSNFKSWSWLKHMHLAEDCHSYNTELFQCTPKQCLKIKATRKILPDEKLVLWFSRDLLIILQIPYLSLNNIQGEKQYICHECTFQCEMPNPLKIHLSLDCGKLSKQYLWKRLQLIKKETTTPVPNITNIQANTSSQPDVQIIELNSNSAFKPYQKIKIDAGKSKTKLQNNRVNKICSVLPNILKNQNMADINETGFFYKQAVEMETIISNLGKLNHGHLCMYCGKIYSRKYGLKIHIRTHTGFKPLKCKYCLRPFGDPSNLNKHVRLHSEGDTPYKCDQCGKILVRKRDLDRHMKSRH